MTNLINIIQNTTHQIKLDALSGTSPYKFSIYEANGYDITDPSKFTQIETTYTGTESELSHTFNHQFNENVGNYTIIGKIEDSCPDGSLTAFSNIYDVNVYLQNLTIISISPTSAPINVGTTIQLTANCKDQFGNNMTCPTLTWNSSNISIATVDNTGKVTGIASGTANITTSNSGIVSNISAITASFPNMLVNPKFEISVPTNWSKYGYGTLPTNPYIYPEIGLTGNCVAIDFGTGNTYTGTASWIQSILSISPNTIYKLSGYMKLQNVTGNAIIEVQWKDSSGAYISTNRIANKNGTIGWANYSGNVTSPSNATKVTVLLRLRNSTGKVYFDNMHFSKQ